jgi:hypothetical protein
MPQWQVSRFRQWVYIIDPDRKIPLIVRHQLIYSQLMDCTIVPWESLTSMVISLALVNGYINDR